MSLAIIYLYLQMFADDTAGCVLFEAFNIHDFP